MLIAEMTLAAVLELYVIRFLQVLFLINMIGAGGKVINKATFFILPASVFMIYSLFFLSNPTVLGNLFNLIWWSGFMCVMNFSIQNEIDFSKFKQVLFKSCFFLTTLSASFGLYKLYLTTTGVFLPMLQVQMSDGNIIPLLGSSLNLDYNVYSVGLFCGAFAGQYCYSHTNKLSLKIIYAAAILVILTSAMLSSSRRGLIIGVLLVLVLMIWSTRKASWEKIKYTGSSMKMRLIKLPWILIIVISSFLFSLTRVDFSKIMESSAEVATLFDRLESVNSLTSKENDTRTNRWAYALEYYMDQPIYAQLFGDGFTYMEFFGSKFEEAEIDHPHNVWISALLYGGVLGFVVTLWLTGYVFYLFFKRRASYSSMFYWYIMFLLLYFSSSNTIFSSRVFIVLELFPLLNFNFKKIDKLVQQKLTLS
jgi:hypothetical protein